MDQGNLESMKEAMLFAKTKDCLHKLVSANNPKDYTKIKKNKRS